MLDLIFYRVKDHISSESSSDCIFQAANGSHYPKKKNEKNMSPTQKMLNLSSFSFKLKRTKFFYIRRASDIIDKWGKFPTLKSSEMSGHGYTYSGGYTTDNSTVPPGKEEWSKTSYTSDVGTQQLHVTKTEIAEVPNFVPGYKQSTPAKVDALIDYGDGDQGKWNSSSNQVRFQEDKQYGPSSPMVATNSIQTPNPHSYHANTGSGNQSKSSKEGQNPGVYTLGGGGGGGGGGYTPVGGGGYTLGGGPVTRESCLVQRSYCFRKYPGTRV